MAPQHRLYSPIDGSLLYLSGVGRAAPYAGSGTPWTSQASSPFMLAMNDVTGGTYGATTAEPILSLVGTPPFTIASGVASRGFATVQEQVGVQVYGADLDAATAALRALKRLLSQASRFNPVMFAYQPDGASAATYFDIYSGIVQELPISTNQESGRGLLRALITWTRSPLGSVRAATNISGEGLIEVQSATSWRNRGTSSPDDVIPFISDAPGDLVYEGQPINVRITGMSGASASQAIKNIFLATIDDRIYATTGAGSIGTNVTIQSGADLINLTPAAQPRLILVGSVSADTVRLTVQARLNGSAGGAYRRSFYPDTRGVYGSNVLIDAGPLPVNIPTNTNMDAPTLNVTLSKSGTGTYTHVSSEILLCHTFAYVDRVATPSAGINGSDEIIIHQVRQVGDGFVAALPEPPASWYIDAAGGRDLFTYDIRGQLPVYIEGASFWMQVDQGGSGVVTAYNTSIAGSVTLEMAPLWFTLRGDDGT